MSNFFIKCRTFNSSLAAVAYSEIISDNCKGSTAIHYHSLLHKAFKSAVKRRIILTNPCDQADRPRMTQFISSYYNQFEVRRLLDAIEDDPLRIVIVLTAYYGLRRSEVLGIKWEAIDFENKEIRIAHKIVNEKQNGKRVAVGHDSMKTKSSYRTLPLLPPVEEELKIEKEKQAKAAAREREREKARKAKELAIQKEKEAKAKAKQKEKERKEKELAKQKEIAQRQKEREAEKARKAKELAIQKEREAKAKAKEREKAAREKALAAAKEKEKIARERAKLKAKQQAEKEKLKAKQKADLEKQRLKEKSVKQKNAEIKEDLNSVE